MGVVYARETPQDNFTPVSTMGVGLASQSQAGLMSVPDKVKLDELATMGEGIIIQPFVSAPSVYGQWVTFAENTLPKGYKWLVIGTVNWSISNSEIQACSFQFSGSDTSVAVDCRTVGNGGGGCAVWGYCETRTASRTVKVRSYGAVNQTYNHNAQYVAIPLAKITD